MTLCSCTCRRSCTLLAVIAAVILGVVATLLQITGTITVTPVFLWVAVGLAVVYLAGLLVTAGNNHSHCSTCLCAAVNTVLAGILGTILFAVVLLAVGIVATSIVSAILVGLLAAFLTLIFAGTACLVRCLTDCES